MIPDHDPHRLEALIHLLIDGDLTDECSAELNAILLRSAEARETYRHTMAVHSALDLHGRDAISIPIFTAPSTAPIPFRRRSFKKNVAIGIAASIALGVSLFLSKQGSEEFATLSGSTSAVWENAELQNGHGFKTGQSVSLQRGYAEIAFRSGVNVIIEGPSRFEITSPDSILVSHGRAAVKVPKGMSGFHLDTPGGRITDLGTEFGVAVGSGSEGPVVMTQVFDGEIEVPEKDSTRRLVSGESLAMVRNSEGTRLLSQIGEYPVELTGTARSLPPKPVATGDSSENLALGKPVFSPAHYSNIHGENFGPWSLTDGRLNDAGSPGDWAFWLAPNGENGEFTVDLLEETTIARVDLQNTRNRTHGDRGIRDFSIQVSDDNRSFHEVASGELARITEVPSPGTDFPIESFSFPPVSTRYVKIVCLSHYSHPERPAEEPNHGGGLNEIRIFSH